MAAIVAVAVAAFASTNLDDLFVLMALFSDPTQRARDVVAGQFFGMFTLTLVALTCTLAAESVPVPYVGTLGLLPLLIGLGRLLFQHGEPGQDDDAPKAGAARNVFVAAAITAANGGDNIAVYVPLLGGRSWLEIALILVVFLIMTVAWCALARMIVAHPRIAFTTARLGPRCLPWVFVALGLYVLVSSRAYTLLSR